MHPLAELGLDLVRERERAWHRLPHWDPRLWQPLDGGFECAPPRDARHLSTIGVDWAKRLLKRLQHETTLKLTPTRPSHGRPEQSEDGRKGGGTARGGSAHSARRQAGTLVALTSRSHTPAEHASTRRAGRGWAARDDLYRVKRLDYEYAAGDDAWTSPFAAELAGSSDPRRAPPSPHVSFAKRILWQTYNYDWLGNTSTTDDDAKGFYDRSLGTVTNDTANDKPYQLRAATNQSGGGTRTGAAGARYDAAGNLTRLDVERNGTCLGSKCSHRLGYEWDEVGRLVRARRWDVVPSSLTTPDDPLPTTAPDADLEYAYDASDDRVLKTAHAGSSASHTLYVFDSLELRRTDHANGDYTATTGSGTELTESEVPYLFGHGVRLGRVVYEQVNDGEPRMTSGAGRQHVFFELGDHLGSTSVVLDKETSELVERGAFQAYGAKESDYRAARWAGFREDYGFTGKEEDVEVGLAYFGKRFLSPYLGRWVSADPLGVHAPGEADLNLYAYVRGAVLKNVDPLGLDEELGGIKLEQEGTIPRPPGIDGPTINVDRMTIGATPRMTPKAAPTDGSAAGEAVLELLGLQAAGAAKEAAELGAQGALTLVCTVCAAYAASQPNDAVYELAKDPEQLLTDPNLLADLTGRMALGGALGVLAAEVPKFSLEMPKAPRIHSRYPDGTPVFEGQQPGKIKGPDPAAEGRPHSRVQWDESNMRVYKAREYGPGEVPERDLDFTRPTFPSGRLRPDHTAPEQHKWIPNDPKNPKAGFKRGPGEPPE